MSSEHAPWMLIGGAALAVYGLTPQANVTDIDVVTTAARASDLMVRHGWPNRADGGSQRFRSQVLLTPSLGAHPVEIMGGFAIRARADWVGADWVEVPPQPDRTLCVQDRAIPLPSPDRLATLFDLCGRPADLDRAKALRLWSERHG